MISVNPNWVVWTLASAFQHYKDKVLVGNDSNLTFLVPSQETPINLDSDRSELIFAGPDFDIVDQENIRLGIRFNILVTTNKDMSNAFYHYNYLAKSLKFFTPCITIRKYGDSNFDQSQVGTLNLDSDIKITDIRPFDPVSRQQISTIEAQYIGDLDGNI